MTYILAFDDPRATDIEMAGGKGANLARLVQAGFAEVPGGFCVTTSAYQEFLSASGLDRAIDELLAALDHTDADQLEKSTAAIRSRIEGAEVPARIAEEVSTSYEALGRDVFVAVRSSGTAEDLAGASFAGLHDTYLDVRGVDGVLEALRRCWASLWTVRATAYRATRGFDSAAVGMCVIVQRMVEAEVSGVLFTGNPVNAEAGEMLIDANWGLGEAVVQGITLPDHWVVSSADMTVRNRELGTKELATVRDPDTGVGTIEQPTSPEQQSRWTLSDEQVIELAGLCRRVQDHYDSVPQDIEWACTQGRFFLLQSRPVTGVEFSWDADVDDWQVKRDDPADYWSRTWADEGWTGAITPLFYSLRAPVWTAACDFLAEITGNYHEMSPVRAFKFHKSEAYWNLRRERLYTELTYLDSWRRLGVWDHLPEGMLEDSFDRNFGWSDLAKLYTRLNVFRPDKDRTFGWNEHMRTYYLENPERTAYANGPSPAHLRRVSDAELKRLLYEYRDFEAEYTKSSWPVIFIYLRDALSLLSWMLRSWYDGDVNTAFIELMSGTAERTATQIENHELWLLSQQIRSSEALTNAITADEPAEFFARLETFEQGRAFLADYRAFVDAHPHRGHSDRDIWFPRRCEDPAVDYNTFRAYMAVDDDPLDREVTVNAAQRARVDEVAAQIRRQPLGAVKVEAFKVVIGWLRVFLPWRDTERNFIDRSTYAIKKIAVEAGWRFTERGLAESGTDFFFLSAEELFTALAGGGNPRLRRMKVQARRRDHERFLHKEADLPMYLHKGVGVDLDTVVEDGVDGSYTGIGTSSGVATGTARVIKTQQELSRLNKGEILVCNATDPGWTSAFNIIKGIVTETGGPLAHAAGLAREYGLPAAQIAKAMQKIPDGATITVDGAAGRVTVHDVTAHDEEF